MGPIFGRCDVAKINDLTVIPSEPKHVGVVNINKKLPHKWETAS